MKRSLALAVALWIASSAPAAAEQEESLGRHAGVGVGAALLTVFYAPLKLAYATTGAVVSGLTFALSAGDAEPARRVLQRSVGGDWVVTPGHLRGEQSFRVVGTATRSETPAVAAGPPEYEPERAGRDWPEASETEEESESQRLLPPPSSGSAPTPTRSNEPAEVPW